MILRAGLSERDRRTLTIGSCAVTALIGLGRGLPALHAWEGEQVAAAYSAASQLALLRSGVRVLPALRDSLRARQLRLATVNSSLLPGVSPSAVAAALASALEDLADDNAIKVTGLQLHSDSAVSAGLARAEVRMTGVTDITGLAGFLRVVESGETPLVVRELSVSQPEPAAGDAKPEALRIEVLVASIGSIKSESRP